MQRSKEHPISLDLDKKIVFIVGPRQVGKTWLARWIGESHRNTVYLNHDNRKDREIILEEAWLPDTDLLILDEFHKMPEWKTYLKGVFDTRPEGMKILVTGSARLDTFRHGGDSLAGRFFAHRLMPFTLAELRDTEHDRDMSRLLTRGGFPEPFLASDPVDADRWRRQYVDGLIRTDILDFERIHDLRAVQILLDLLRERVGAPASYASLARDVGVAPNTVRKYVQILEALFIVFRVTPYSKKIARSLLKEPKLYFFDTGMVAGDDGARFENFVALSLHTHALHRTDEIGLSHKLHYMRTKDGAEVDFCLVPGDGPPIMIEAKVGDETPGKSIRRMHEATGFRAIQLVARTRRERMAGPVEIRDAARFLRDLS